MRAAFALLLMTAMLPWVQAQQTPAVPIGITDLFSVATPTVGYQQDGKAPVTLGYGWTGYDAASGVYFVPESAADGGNQVFMHCPWAAGPGVSFADYALTLPQAPRVLLKFDLGLRPGANGSDGVTYRVIVAGKRLFEHHATWQELRPFQADLSAYAGQEIVLRLEVDPGPARNTTDDWSLWHAAQILAGSEAQIAAAQAQAAAEAARQRAADLARGGRLAEASLLPLTSHTSDTVRPGTLAPTQTALVAQGNAYVLRCQGAEETIEYRFSPAAGFPDGLAVSLNGHAMKPAPFRCGPVLHLDGRDFPTPTALLKCELLSAKAAEGKLTCEWRYTNPDTHSAATLAAVLQPAGKSLQLEVSGAAGLFGGFVAQANGGRIVPATFAFPVRWRPEGVYLSSIVDLMGSHASGIGNGDMTSYAPLTDGRRNAMHDTFYLTVTSRYEEALSGSAHKPSPFLGELAHRVVLDGWGGDFADNQQWLRDMSRYDVDSFLMIKHVWQRDGYDHSYPDTMPASSAMGGDAALRSLSETAQKLGHRFCVHENYYDYYPNAESFKEADRALDPQGKPFPGWDNGQVRAVILKPSKLMDYVREFTPQIKQRYDCNAAYHDIMPTWNEDFDAKAPGAGRISYTHEQTQALCDFDRSLFGGPVVFEAADPQMAGVYDGGCNHGVDTYRTPVAVAAELLKVHPKMSNHGFGYYERWLPWGYSKPEWSSYVMTDRELDKYRAYTVAFGRTGFVGQQLMKYPHGVVREYHLMQAFGRAYTGKLAARIRYEVEGTWVDAGTAARLGDFSRLNVEYLGGQQVYVNLSATPWRVAGRELPPDGSLTVGPRAEAGTTVRGGQIVDYSRYDTITYADARSHQWQPPRSPAPLTPSVASFRALGGSDFELTVNWKPERKLERDYIIFWHFIDQGIEFQWDHAPAKPTSAWGVGETVTDGPGRLRVKDDAKVTSYEVRVGLYDREGRVPLVEGALSVRLGRLVVQREGAVARSVRFEAQPEEPAPGSTREPYLVGANTARRVIDFGEVATNGAAVMKSEGGQLAIVPVPLGEVFTVGLAGSVKTVAALDAAGKALPAPKLSRHDGKTWFETSAGLVRYVVER